MTTTLRQSRARKAFFCGTTALSLALVASAAQAQCADPRIATGGGGGFSGFTLPIGSTVSGVQSLVSALTTQNTAFLTQTSGFIGAPGNVAPGTQGGGVWTRGIGGTFDTKAPGSYTVNPSLLGSGSSGSCNVRSFSDYAGFQMGADISRLNINGYNIHTGVTVGYSESSTRSAGGFGADLQTPFIGLYGAVTKDSFFADAQVRWDYYQGTLNQPSNTLNNQRLDAQSVSLTGNLGYQIPLNDGWFIEPSGGAVYATTSVDPLRTAGAILVLGSGSAQAPATTKIRDFESILARGSLRFGKNVVMGSYALQPFVTASVINEFGAPVNTLIATNFGEIGRNYGIPAFGLLDQSATVTTKRIGTYGQFSGGIAGQLLNTGWLGYVRGDYRTGERVEGWGISGGLRYQFTPQGLAGGPVIKGADASLLPALDGPVNWSGWSLGASVGSLWGETEQRGNITGLAPAPLQNESAGLYAGGQAGLDYQVNNIVFGLAADAGYTNASGGRACGQFFLGNVYNCQTNVRDLYMGTARVGYAYERALIYAKGGAALAHTSEKFQDNIAGAPYALTGLPFTEVRGKAFSTGWTIGGGVEFALTRSWSAKAEFMHFELERENFRNGVSRDVNLASAQHSGQLLKIGVNYRFDPAPLAAAAPVAASY